MNDAFWSEADPTAVARRLLGKSIISGGVEAVVLGTEGYPREQNTGLYGPVQSMQPGEVYCPRRRNSILLLVVTHGGGCVLVRTVEVHGVVHDGPGKTTAALGLEVPRARGKVRWIDNDTIALTFDEQAIAEEAQPAPTRSHRNGNGIGEETLRELMPNLVDAYMRQPIRGRKSFEQFCNDLLACCQTEWDLRQLLRK